MFCPKNFSKFFDFECSFSSVQIASLPRSFAFRPEEDDHHDATPVAADPEQLPPVLEASRSEVSIDNFEAPPPNNDHSDLEKVVKKVSQRPHQKVRRIADEDSDVEPGRETR
jgi:hypothetical protein